MIKVITEEEYWQIVGLLALAKQCNDRMDDIEASIRFVLRLQKADEKQSGVGDPQHIGDAVYSRYSPDELLEKLGIKRAAKKFKKK